MMPPIPTPTLQATCLNHLYEHRLLRDVVDRSALSTIFFLPGSQYAAYSEECQRLHYYEAANITECKVTHPPTEMADIQGKPDPAAKEIINRLLAETGQASRYSTDVPDELWELMVPFLVPLVRTKSGGSPQTPLRTMINGIFYRTKTGCQWELLPKHFGSKSSVHEFYQKLNSTGILEKILALVSLYYEAIGGYDFTWQSADGSIVQAPARAKMDAAEGFGANPTDRRRKGTKFHVRCDANGVPIAIEITGANTHDSQILEANFQNIFAPFKNLESPLDGEPHNICLDSAYVGQKVAECMAQHLLYIHVRPRNEEIKEKDEFPPRRWVVERLIAWLKGFRCIRTRYTCYLQNFIGDFRLASIRIIWRKIVKAI